MSDDQASLFPSTAGIAARGARMVPFAGYEMPIQYEGIIAEHRWTRESAGLFDVSHMGQLIVAGARREKGLEALLPADLAILKDSKPKYSLLLNAEGGIIDDLMVTRRGEHFYLVVNGATKHGDIAHLEAKLPRGVVLDHMKEQALLALQGPKAVDALARLAPGVAELTFMTAGAFELARRARLDQPLGLYRRGRLRDFDPGRARRPRIADLLCRAARGEADRARRARFAAAGGGAAALRPRSRSSRPRRSRPISSSRLSKRRRAEGGFPGWERIAQELADGPIRKRVGLKIEGRQPVREGAAVVDGDGDEVGKVTSGGFSPSARGADRHGLCAGRVGRAGQPRSASSSAASLSRRRSLPMPFVPHRYKRKGAPA